MYEKDLGNLLAIIDACDKIGRFTAGTMDADSFYQDEKTFDSVLMNLIVIGESVARLDDEIKERESHIPWTKIKGVRNIVTHDYFGVDAEEVWQIVNNNIPQLKADIKEILTVE